ncbi:glycoside hydrolase 43 family protein [Parvularcula sp. LCG005]|uniref:glycoside hydrolase family 43 protein n=1 Tax=Parvularcula sp. LCG005 TaxID=3078805 RepID=UPI002943591D|nr:glycoside hydrolase 43 family protein [Parvularcula sp. LCG005]WOI53780.1 glycoside hydrolase 43 family protein [Parvularcula sp. LCG005]
MKPSLLSVFALGSFFVLAGCSGGTAEEASVADNRIASVDRPLPEGAPLRMADHGDGTFTNPPLWGDFPDPSIIRVDNTFFFATTTFANVPALTILESKDLVNWQYTAHLIDRLEGDGAYDLEDGGAYRKGIFAPSLRYHEGTYYLAVTPVGLNTRIYYTDDIRGDWQYHELDREAFDPALFFDDDGTFYLATSLGYDGTVTLLVLSDDGSEVIKSDEIYYNEGAEGTKILKRNGYYYMFHSIPRRLGMTVSRARDFYGPWETVDQIDDTTGGHQGAIVDLPDGTDYGFVMVDAGAIGRMTNISPMHWVDDWPVWGTPDAPGQVPAKADKPIKGHKAEMPATSDDFAAEHLGLQWQWNHNPVRENWSLTERPGHLRLKPLAAEGFWTARNTLTQKSWGPFSRGEVKLDISSLTEGDHCGFGMIGKYSAYISVDGGDKGQHTLSMTVSEDTTDGQVLDRRAEGINAAANHLYLRTDMDFETDRGQAAYSFDAENWTVLGGDFPLAFDWQTGTFQGEQFAIFCYADGPSAGHLDVDAFQLSGRPPAP